jgi:hypothetical protein
MAILENIATRSGRQPFAGLNANAAQNQQGDKPRAQLWLNIGYTAGEGEAQRFISLQPGMSIDTLETRPIRGQNTDFAKVQAAQNELLESLQKLGFNLEPGQEVTLNLEVRMRRVNNAVTVASKDNEYAVPNLMQALVAKPAPVEQELQQAAE